MNLHRFDPIKQIKNTMQDDVGLTFDAWKLGLGMGPGSYVMCLGGIPEHSRKVTYTVSAEGSRRKLQFPEGPRKVRGR